MMRRHYEEVTRAPLKNVLKIDPWWAEYLEIQDSGELVLVAAWDATVAVPAPLVGYIILIVRPHLHYSGVTVAVNDLHYLYPEYRGAGWGKKMIEFAEDCAKKKGAKLFSMRTKAALSHGHIFEAMGYHLTDLVYVKDLTNEK